MRAIEEINSVPTRLDEVSKFDKRDNNINSQKTTSVKTSNGNKGWKLGQTSEIFESSNKGPGKINSKKAQKGDKGGASYGSFQIATNTGTMKKYMKMSRYRKHLEGLTPGTEAFDDKWKEIARKDPVGFKADQREFIKKHTMTQQLRRLKKIILIFLIEDWPFKINFGEWQPNMEKEKLLQ